MGKDFNVRWSIRKRVDGEGQPYELAGKELVLQYRRPNGTLHEAKEWRVEGNIIIWTFRGRDQKAPGLYGLILTENGGKDGMVTVDTCRAFNLVAHSCEETEGSGSDIVIEDVVLESEVTFAALRGPQGEQGPAGPQGPQGERGPEGPQGPAGPSYDDTEIKDKLAELSEELASNGVLIEDLQNTKIEKENDDYYPKMAVGLADNLAGVDVVDSEINFRRSGGGAITDGVARIETIKGNSVVWNNLIEIVEAVGLVKSKMTGELINGVFKGSTIAEKTAADLGIPALKWERCTAGHKYMWVYDGTNSLGLTISASIGATATNGQIIAPSSAAYCYFYPFGVSGTVPAGSEFEIKSINFFDLTQMFGAGNEPTTIEEFYARIPMGVDLNAYNEGEVIHMDVQSIESQGVNAWDEEWENGTFNTTTGANINDAYRLNQVRSKSLIEILPNTQYTIRQPSLENDGAWVMLFDKDKNIIVGYKGGTAISGNSFKVSSNKPNFITAPNAAYMRFYMPVGYGDTYNHDICINLSDTSVNGKYFPYIKRVEDLSIIRKYFPQGMKSAPTAHDAIRYNKESGKWEKVEATGIRAYQDGDADNAAYLTDGKVTCYPLAEPIVTELDEADQFKDLDYAVWNAGTEKAIAEGKSSALAADITYGFNAIGKIKELESLVAALRAKVGI